MKRQSSSKRYQPREPVTPGDRRHEGHKLFSMAAKSNSSRRAFLPKEFLPSRQATDHTTGVPSEPEGEYVCSDQRLGHDLDTPRKLPLSDSTQSSTSFRINRTKLPHSRDSGLPTLQFSVVRGSDSIDLESLVISQPGSPRDHGGYDEFGARSEVHDLNIQISFPKKKTTPKAPRHKKDRRDSKHDPGSRLPLSRHQCPDDLGFCMTSHSNTVSTPQISLAPSNTSVPCNESNPMLSSLSRQISPTPSETHIAHLQHRPQTIEKPHGRRHSFAGKQNHRSGDWRRQQFLQEKKTHDCVENVDDCFSPRMQGGSPKSPATENESTDRKQSGTFRSVFAFFGSKKGAVLDDASSERTPVRTKDPTFALESSSRFGVTSNTSSLKTVKKRNSI